MISECYLEKRKTLTDGCLKAKHIRCDLHVTHTAVIGYDKFEFDRTKTTLQTIYLLQIQQNFYDKYYTFSLETSTREMSYENARTVNSVAMTVHVVLVFIE